MLIALDLMSAFVRCRYQAYLKCTGEVGEASGYALLQRELASDYEQKACANLAESLAPCGRSFRPTINGRCLEKPPPSDSKRTER